MESKSIPEVTSTCKNPCTTSVGHIKMDMAYLCFRNLLQFLMKCNTKLLDKYKHSIIFVSAYSFRWSSLRPSPSVIHCAPRVSLWSLRVTLHLHHKRILIQYSLKDQTFENVQTPKYLVITITDNMNWGQQISEISSKAATILDFLCRNLAFAPRLTMEVAYQTLVQPLLEYAALFWSPYSKLQIKQIEKVQTTDR